LLKIYTVIDFENYAFFFRKWKIYYYDLLLLGVLNLYKRVYYLNGIKNCKFWSLGTLKRIIQTNVLIPLALKSVLDGLIADLDMGPSSSDLAVIPLTR